MSNGRLQTSNIWEVGSLWPFLMLCAVCSWHSVQNWDVQGAFKWETEALSCFQDKKYLFLVFSVKKILKVNIYQMSKCTFFFFKKPFTFIPFWGCGWFWAQGVWETDYPPLVTPGQSISVLPVEAWEWGSLILIMKTLKSPSSKAGRANWTFCDESELVRREGGIWGKDGK